MTIPDKRADIVYEIGLPESRRRQPALQPLEFDPTRELIMA
jgi:hypothetical protein